jgi:hypothetical protein
MHLLILISLLATQATALPNPVLLIIESSPSPVSEATNSTTPCSAAVLALASGIQSNIADQYNELTTVTALGNVLAQNPLDTTLYSATQGSLLGFVTKGIAIRENNQKIAPAGNGALPGLATVATAQLTELSLTMSLALTGNGTDVGKANAVSSFVYLGDGRRECELI